MIYLNDFLNLTNFRITGGSEYLWHCFGSNARFLDSHNDKYDLSCIFDTLTQELYSIEFSTHSDNKSYRWINSKYKQNFIDENEERGINYKIYCDDEEYVDFDNIHDLFTIIDDLAGLMKYTVMSINLDDDVLLFLTKRAMELNITVDQLICNILRDEIKNIQDHPEQYAYLKDHAEEQSDNKKIGETD